MFSTKILTQCTFNKNILISAFFSHTTKADHANTSPLAMYKHFHTKTLIFLSNIWQQEKQTAANNYWYQSRERTENIVRALMLLDQLSVFLTVSLFHAYTHPSFIKLLARSCRMHLVTA